MKDLLLLVVFLLKIFSAYGEELYSNISSDNQTQIISEPAPSPEREEKEEQVSPDIEDPDSVVYDSDIVDISESGVGTEVVAEATNRSAQVSNSTSKNRLACNITESITSTDPPTVHLVNGSTFQTYIFEEFNSSVANRSQSAVCSITMFFASWCQFSAEAAPHFNALARVFPQIRLYAVDSSEHHSLNTQFGVMAVPSIFVFHNSRPLYKYNYTEYSLESFTQFVTLLTGLDPVKGTQVTEDDFVGPVPSVAVQSTNYYLLLSLIFSLICGVWQLSHSQTCLRIVDSLRNNWREAEIQHQHQD